MSEGDTRTTSQTTWADDPVVVHIAGRLTDAERRALLWLPGGEFEWRGPAPRGLAHALTRLSRGAGQLTERSEPHPVTRLVDYCLTDLGRRVQAVVVKEDIPQ